MNHLRRLWMIIRGPKMTRIPASLTDPHRRARWVEAVLGLPNPCKGGHAPMTLCQGTVWAVICAVCTTRLPDPPWLSCPACIPIVLDGWSMHHFCSTHQQPNVAPKGEPAR